MKKTIKLYHGTSKEFSDKILKCGLNNPYLTISKELAYYYAEASDGWGREVVLEVYIKDTSKLRIDYPSLEEPVGFGNIHSKTLEDNVELMFDELRINDKSYSDCDYHISLDTVYTCKYDGVINPKNIKIIFPIQ